MKPLQHPNFESSRSDFYRLMDDFRPGHMIALIGQSGVGKSTLRHSCMREMFGRADLWGTGHIPIIEVFPSLSSNSYFNSKNLGSQMHDNLNIPDLSWMGAPPVSGGWHEELVESIRARKEQWRRMKRRQMTESDVWEAVAECIDSRACKYISIEQVTSLLVNRRNTEPAAHLLNLLNLCERTQIMMILTGVTGAHKIWSTHTELRRRIKTVWVRGYSDKEPGDEVPFLRLLKSLSLCRALSKETLLLEMAPDIMAATAGIIGEVELLLDRATMFARSRESKTIGRRDIKAAFYNATDLEALWRETEEFRKVSKGGNVSKEAERVRANWSSQRGQLREEK